MLHQFLGIFLSEHLPMFTSKKLRLFKILFLYPIVWLTCSQLIWLAADRAALCSSCLASKSYYCESKNTH